MATVSVGSVVIQNWQDIRTSVELLIFCSPGFIGSNGVPIPSGSTSDKVVYKRVPCTVNTTSKTLAISAFTLMSTIDGLDIQTAVYNAWFFAVRGDKIGAEIKAYDGFSEFRVPTTASQNWVDISLYNLNYTSIIQNPNAYTKDQSLATFALASVVVNAAQTNIENEWSASQVFTENGQSLTWDGNSQESLSAASSMGRAPLLLEPEFFYSSGTNFRSVGMGVRPTFGATGSVVPYYTAYNAKIGNSTTPVPVGTKGQMVGYEANIDTAQVLANLSANESGHAFGATLVARGGAPMSILDGTVLIDGAAADTEPGVRGVNVSIVNNEAGSVVYGLHVESAGSESVPALFRAVGDFDYGFDLSQATNMIAAAIIPNNIPIQAKTSAAADLDMIKLNSSNIIEFGNHILVNVANPFVQVADWLFQQVALDGRIRFFRQGYGNDVMSMIGADPANGETSMKLLVTKGAVTSVVQVKVAAVDTAGSGKRALCVDN